MKAIATFWLLLPLTLCFTARSDSGIERQLVGDGPPASPTSRHLLAENAMLRVKLARIQDALADASDEIETAKHLLLIENEPAALEYATSQLNDAMDAIDDAADEADSNSDEPRFLDAAFAARARTNAKPAGIATIAIEAGLRSAIDARHTKFDSNSSGGATDHLGKS